MTISGGPDGPAFLNNKKKKSFPWKILLLFLCTAAAGYAASGLEFRLYPNSAEQHYCIRTVFEGMAAETMDRSITVPISEFLSRLPGIREMRSVSSRGESLVYLTLRPGADNEEFRTELSLVLIQLEKYLPAGAHPPYLSRSSSDPDVVYVASFPAEVHEKTEAFARQLELLEGIARVQSSTRKYRQYTAHFNLGASSTSGFTPLEIARILRNAAHGAVFHGRFSTSHGNTLTVAVPPNLKLGKNESIEHPSTLTALTGNLISLDSENNPPSRIEKINGIPVQTVAVLADADAGIISLCGKIEKIRENYPESELVFNKGKFLSRVLHSAVFAVILGVAAVVLLLLIQTGGYSREQSYIFLTLPISLGMSIIALGLFGFSLDIMTLSGTAVASGLIVDTAVLFYEESSAYGTVEAVKNIRGPVITANGTTLVVFLPILLMPPEIRSLFTGFMVVITASLLTASFWTLFILPPVLLELPVKAGLLKGLHRRHRFVLKTTGGNPWMGGLVLLTGLGFAAIHSELPEFTPFPALETETVDVEVEVPSGLPPRVVDQLTVPIAEYLDDGSDALQVTTSATSDGGNIRFRSSDSKILSRIVRRTAAYGAPAGVGLRVLEDNHHEAGIKIMLFGRDPVRLRRLILETASKIHETNPDLKVYHHFKEQPPTEILSFIPFRCLAHGISPFKAAGQLSAMFTSLPAAKLQNGTDHDLLLRAAGSFDSIESLLREALITTSAGPLPLSSIVHHHREKVPERIQRLNGVLYTGLTIVPPNAKNSATPAALAGEMSSLLGKFDLPAGYHLEIAPEIKKNLRTRTKLLAGTALAALLVVLVIYGYYGRFYPTFVVLLHIPPPVLISLLFLRLTGTSFSIPVLSGMLVVIGISINNIVILLPKNSQFHPPDSVSIPSMRFALSEKLPSLAASTLTTTAGVIPLLIGGISNTGLPAGLSIVVTSGSLTAFLLLFLSCALLDTLHPGPSRSSSR